MTYERMWPDLPLDDVVTDAPKTRLRLMLEQLPEARALLAELREVGIVLTLAGETIRWRTTRETAMSIAQIRDGKRLTPGVRGILRTEDQGRSA